MATGGFVQSPINNIALKTEHEKKVGEKICLIPFFAGFGWDGVSFLPSN